MKYICIGGQQQNYYLKTEQTIALSSAHKYLGMKIFGEDTLDETISDRNILRRRAVKLLNTIGWNIRITTENLKNRQLNRKKHNNVLFGGVEFKE